MTKPIMLDGMGLYKGPGDVIEVKPDKFAQQIGGPLGFAVYAYDPNARSHDQMFERGPIALHFGKRDHNPGRLVIAESLDPFVTPDLGPDGQPLYSRVVHLAGDFSRKPQVLKTDYDTAWRLLKTPFRNMYDSMPDAPAMRFLLRSPEVESNGSEGYIPKSLANRVASYCSRGGIVYSYLENEESRMQKAGAPVREVVGRRTLLHPDFSTTGELETLVGKINAIDQLQAKESKGLGTAINVKADFYGIPIVELGPHNGSWLADFVFDPLVHDYKGKDDQAKSDAVQAAITKLAELLYERRNTLELNNDGPEVTVTTKPLIQVMGDQKLIHVGRLSHREAPYKESGDRQLVRPGAVMAK